MKQHLRNLAIACAIISILCFAEAFYPQVGTLAFALVAFIIFMASMLYVTTPDTAEEIDEEEAEEVEHEQ